MKYLFLVKKFINLNSKIHNKVLNEKLGFRSKIQKIGAKMLTFLQKKGRNGIKNFKKHDFSLMCSTKVDKLKQK